MTLPEEIQKQWPFVWESGRMDWISLALEKDDFPKNVHRLSDGYYSCQVYSDVVITFFKPTPESLAPFMELMMKLIAKKESEYHGDPYETIEVGIYSPSDIRAWKVHRGI